MQKYIFVVLVLISTIAFKASGRPRHNEEDADQYRKDLINKLSLKDAVENAYSALASKRRREEREQLADVDDSDYEEDDENLRENDDYDDEEPDYPLRPVASPGCNVQ